ncbi:MAG: hypothetical protein GYA24_16865 [Candidatus Lokiarchaeota archaeon]|nr:hypothetical protein [Candidatus Lokiarchaeota archaeon]
MKVLIISPGNEPKLGRVALSFKQHLLGIFNRIVVDSIMLEDLQGPALLEQHDMMVIGTPTIKGDIYWPLQVTIDGLMHRIPRGQIATKIATGFTISNSLLDSARNLEAVLWVFKESNARIIQPLILQDGCPEDRMAARIGDFIHDLKGIVV